MVDSKKPRACSVKVKVVLTVTLESKSEIVMFVRRETELDSEIEADSIGDVYIGGSFGLRPHQNSSEEADVREISEGRGATEAKELIWCRGLAHKEVADIYLTTHYHYYMPIHAIQGSGAEAYFACGILLPIGSYAQLQAPSCGSVHVQWPWLYGYWQCQ